MTSFGDPTRATKFTYGLKEDSPVNWVRGARAGRATFAPSTLVSASLAPPLRCSQSSRAPSRPSNEYIR